MLTQADGGKQKMKRNDGVSLDELQVLTGKSKDWVRDRLRVQPPGYEHDLHHVLNRCPGGRFTARPIGCSSYSGRVGFSDAIAVACLTGLRRNSGRRIMGPRVAWPPRGGLP